MSLILRLVAGGLLATVVVGLAAWGALALWFTLPLADGLRGALAATFAALGLGGLLLALLRRRIVLPLLPFALTSVLVLAWWSTITPSNERDWLPDVARLPSAEIEGELVTLRNVRSFTYRTATDYSEHWYDKTVDLSELDSVDLIAVYWGSDEIAHTMASFGFAGEPVTISIETRKEQGEDYSTLAGFFRRYELYYVVADERDLIGLRTTYREPPEDVYLYRVHMPRENMRRLFLAYLGEINSLHQRPEFYTTLTSQLHHQHRAPYPQLPGRSAVELEDAGERPLRRAGLRVRRARPEHAVRRAAPGEPDQRARPRRRRRARLLPPHPPRPAWHAVSGVGAHPAC